MTKIAVTLTAQEAAALAAFFKCAGLNDLRACATRQAEACLALHAATKIASALEQDDYS